MRKTARLTGTLLLAALALTACGDDDESPDQESPEGEAAPAEEEGPDAADWFAENCPAEVNNIREEYEDDELVGDVLGEAMTQGAVHPPAGLEGSTHEIGLYSYDELGGTWVQEGTASSDDLFCFENSMSRDRAYVSDMEGDLYQDESSVALAEMRSPEHPEGIWVAARFSGSEGRGSGFDVEGDWAACQGEWHPATEVTPLEDAPEGDGEISEHNTVSVDDC